MKGCAWRLQGQGRGWGEGEGGGGVVACSYTLVAGGGMAFLVEKHPYVFAAEATLFSPHWGTPKMAKGEGNWEGEERWG